MRTRTPLKGLGRLVRVLGCWAAGIWLSSLIAVSTLDRGCVYSLNANLIGWFPGLRRHEEIFIFGADRNASTARGRFAPVRGTLASELASDKLTRLNTCQYTFPREILKRACGEPA
jgi:hypothetical protein